MSCVFCDPAIQERSYYSGHGWFVFLDANGILPGHSILAREASNGCPAGLTRDNLEGVHMVLPRIADLLQAEYQASNVLVTSLRGSLPHVHFHLVPLVPEVEAAWRQHAGWEQGHLHEFLGHYENLSFVRNLRERLENAWATDEQISNHVEKLREETRRLRAALEGPPNAASHPTAAGAS